MMAWGPSSRFHEDLACDARGRLATPSTTRRSTAPAARAAGVTASRIKHQRAARFNDKHAMAGPQLALNGSCRTGRPFEWLYMKFESKPFNTVFAEGPRSSVPLDDNVVRAGINYRFGGPVVAKY